MGLDSSAKYTSLSTDHIFLNDRGEVKILIPITAPYRLPSCRYYRNYFFNLAPEDEPGSKNKPSSSFSRYQTSMVFSIGMVAV